MRVETASEVGHVRRRNEDDLLVDLDRSLLVVADGMGGHPAGDVASRLAVRAIDESLSADALADAETRPETLREAVRLAHDALLSAAEADPERAGMGTTLVVVHLDEPAGLLTVAHVGDSRAYLLRSDDLRVITHDHVADGLAGRRLTQAVGASRDVRPEVAEVPVRSGDRVLLCTDGLTDEIPDDLIRRLATPAAADAPEAVRELVAAALDAGGVDNVTLILADIVPPKGRRRHSA
jgi:serine/threonine protein phosphatase PrpC